jgi:DNA-binding transcriptional ArsR family regulator
MRICAYLRGKVWPWAGAMVDELDLSLRAELEELTTSICRALNDPKRLMILYALSDRALSVGELCNALGASQSNVSQHLAVLRDRGLVDTSRAANRVMYSLRHRRVLDAIDLLRGVMGDELVRRQALHRQASA